MKRYLGFLKWIAVIGLLVFLYVFASGRRGMRPIKEVAVTFVEEIRPFISELSVNKLLIQNQDGATNLSKETLVLNTVEAALEKNDMIAEADVYLTVDGTLKTKIIQRSPIARVGNGDPFYIDAAGLVMPISNSYTARVPLVYGINEGEIAEVFPLLQELQEDDFLKQQVISISKIQSGQYELSLRVFDFKVHFGAIENCKVKIKNFKAFYQKALKDNSLETYQSVNLQYDNQVVCIRKESKK